MAARLQPERLGPSPEANSGAPIVGPDNVVESGNGRTLAIAKAYAQGRGGAYKSWLENQGYDTSGMKQPVLIARRVTPMTDQERVAFAHSANSSSGLRMNASEQASADAKIMSGIQPPENGPIGSAENRPFVRSFLSKLPASERGGFLDADGNLSQNGVKRMQAAMASRAYGDSPFIARAFDEADPNIKGLANAMVDASPSWIKMRNAARDGVIDPSHDITPDLMNATRAVMRARDAGVPVSTVLNQRDMFGGETSGPAKNLIMSADGSRIASRSQIAARMQSYADEAQKNLSGPNLFGDKIAPADVLKTAISKNSDLSDGVGDEPPSVSAAMQPPSPISKVVPPNFDAGAAQRLAAANAAYALHAQTYSNGPVADILKTNGYKDQFTTPNSGVVAKAFPAGDKGFDVVSAHLEAADNSPDAIQAMQEMAVTRLREKMGGKDQLTLKALASWKQDYQHGLRAIDEVSPGFSSKFDSTANATDMVARGLKLSDDAKAAVQKGAIAPFLKATHPDEIKGSVGKLLAAPDGATQIRGLLKKIGDNPDAVAGLKRAGVESLLNAFSNAGTAGGERVLSGAKLLSSLDKRSGALSALLGQDGLNTLRQIAVDQSRAQVAIDAARVKGGSDTTVGTIGALKKLAKAGHAPSIGTVMMLTGGEALMNGELVPATGIAALAGLKAFVGNRMARGNDAVDKIYQNGLRDPNVGRALLQRAFDNNGKPNPSALVHLSAALTRSIASYPAMSNQQTQASK